MTRKAEDKYKPDVRMPFAILTGNVIPESDNRHTEACVLNIRHKFRLNPTN
jgi:hypothetical protein